MSETIANLAQKNARNAMQRVDKLEKEMEFLQRKALPGLVQSIQQSLGNVDKQLAAALEVVDALVVLLGDDKVQETMNANRKRIADQNEEEAVAAIATRLNDGSLIQADSIAENTLLVFRRSNEDGTPVPYNSRVEISFANLKDDFKTELLGKGRGHKVKGDETPVMLYEVTEIYTPVEVKP